MGRTYYSTARPGDKRDSNRVVRILTVPAGTVVLAMRPPEQGERGYSIGVDFTVMQAVTELLTDWNPDDEGPGWPCDAHNQQRAYQKIAPPSEQLYDVTILAAFENDVVIAQREIRTQREREEERGDVERDAMIYRAAEVIRRWPLVPKDEEFDRFQGNAEIAEACIEAALDGTMPTFLRPECPECHECTDDDGECGECANCRMPLCVHDIPDEKWNEIADRFDPPCDRWKLKADGQTLDAEATHAKGGV